MAYGNQRQFQSGAVRDCDAGKGKPRLIPARILFYIYSRMASPNLKFVLPLGKIYSNGGVKYGDDNWKLGIPLESFVDSALRHAGKYDAGYVDEPHLVQYLWNLIGIYWTLENLPDLNTLNLNHSLPLSMVRIADEHKNAKSLFDESVRCFLQFLAGEDSNQLMASMVYAAYAINRTEHFPENIL